MLDSVLVRQYSLVISHLTSIPIHGKDRGDKTQALCKHNLVMKGVKLPSISHHVGALKKTETLGVLYSEPYFNNDLV